VVEAKGGTTVVAYAKDDDVIAAITAFKEANKPVYEPRPDRGGYNRRPRPDYHNNHSGPYTPRTENKDTAAVTDKPKIVAKVD
jgi:hypothetical protein